MSGRRETGVPGGRAALRISEQLRSSTGAVQENKLYGETRMQAQQNNDLLRVRGPGSHSYFITLGVLILIALLAGLVFYAGSAQAVSTIRILDNETGGDCSTIGEWDPDAKICRMNTDLSVDGIDAIHIEL
ncbi:MAG: hypothetical protein ACYC6O_01295 [Thermoleophilia bacterium]